MIEELQRQLDCINEVRRRGPFSSEFEAWRNKCLSTIEGILGTDSSYAGRFKAITYLPHPASTRVPEVLRENKFLSGLDQARLLMEDCSRYISEQEQELDNLTHKSVQFIENLCNRFPRISRQICTEYRGRKSINIEDEYDVQHILHALLIVRFDDIRPEDVNPSYAGATSRVDFLLKQEKIVIEVKKTRATLKDKEIGEQLIIDIGRYSQNQNCETLICFIYDPDRLISNPDGLERDLSGRRGKLEVKIIIAPRD